jgi:pimeloyl-ACP methyl ester carboxylesterase/class 3 adenylate cyclase
VRHEVAKTRYVSVGDADVAYKVVGEGPIDLVYFYGLGSHVDHYFDDPAVAGWISGLQSLGRLIMFDRRGTGASDRVGRHAVPTWEEWTEDVTAVLEAADSHRPTIFAALDAGPIAMLFAAMHPDRVGGLILANTSARFLADDDYPIGASPEDVARLVDAVERLWGTEDLTKLVNPALANDVLFVRENARRLRAAATPRTAAAQYNHLLRRDARTVLPLIQAPTLVLHTRHNPLIPLEHGRYIAEHIPGSRFVEIPGRGIAFDDGGSGRVLVELSEFLTGRRREVEIDRLLATVLFTDIVASTEHVVATGDRRWRTTLDAHDRIVRERLARFGGAEVTTTGDGFVASFDGAARAVRCAQQISQAVRTLGIEVRCGLHVGECELRRGDLVGLTVHVAARVGALAGPSEVLITSAVNDFVDGSGLQFTKKATERLKGVPGTWNLFALRN